MHRLMILAFTVSVFRVGFASPVPTTPEVSTMPDTTMRDLFIRTQLHLIMLSSKIQSAVLNYETIREPQRSLIPPSTDAGVVTMCIGPQSTLMLILTGDYVTALHQHECILRAFDYLLDTVLVDERIFSWAHSFESEVQALQDDMLTASGLLQGWVQLLQPLSSISTSTQSTSISTSTTSSLLTRPPYTPGSDMSVLVLRDFVILQSLKDAVSTLFRDVVAIGSSTA